MAWSFTPDVPIYLQAARVLRLRILKGAYPPGGAVPSVRELAQEAAVNPNTMQKALSLLEAQGLLTTQRTAGRRVTEEGERLTLLRRSMAEEILGECRRQLLELGYTPEEIVQLMKEESK
jgi:DNA-binding transcriptional regulator YhcF (GntR family)